jgi:hypothetical protein
MMTRIRSSLAFVACAVTLAAVPAVPAIAAESPLGPPLGNVRYRSTIEPGPEGKDVDDYVGALVVGEQLSAKVSTNINSALFPTLEVIDPDGEDRTPELSSRNIGKTISFKKLVVDKTGDWVVRIGGRIGSGTYTAAIAVKKAPAFQLHDVAVGGAGDNPLAVGSPATADRPSARPSRGDAGPL